MGGILDYKARFYSPALGRFIQPDSIIPNAANPQAFNRFSYVYNRPINFNDPTGHDAHWCETASCQAGYYTAKKDGFFAAYGVEVDRNMNSRERLDIMVAISAVGNQMAETRGNGETAAEAFTAVYDPITFEHRDNYGGCETTLTYKISCGDFTYNHPQSSVNNIVHELGHILNNLIGGDLYDFALAYADPEVRRVLLRPDETIDWQQNTFYNIDNPYNTVKTSGEMFGDMFVAWVFDAWNTNSDYVDSVNDARTTMNTNMAEWIK